MLESSGSRFACWKVLRVNQGFCKFERYFVHKLPCPCDCTRPILLVYTWTGLYHADRIHRLQPRGLGPPSRSIGGTWTEMGLDPPWLLYNLPTHDDKCISVWTIPYALTADHEKIGGDAQELSAAAWPAHSSSSGSLNIPISC